MRARQPGSAGAVLDPCVLLRVRVRLEPGAATRVRFSLTTASTVQGASSAAKRVLSEGAGHYSRLDDTARQLGLGDELIDEAMALLPDIVAPSPDRRIDADVAQALARGQKALWALGVSGDLPIVAAEIGEEVDIDSAERLLGAHRLLSLNNVQYDLVYLIKGGGDYRSRLKNELTEALKLTNPDRHLDTRGGVHLAELPSPGAESVRAVSVLYFKSGGRAEPYVRDETTKPVCRPFLDATPIVAQHPVQREQQLHV